MKRELMGLIVKRDDGSEIVNYDNPQFPSYIFEGWVLPNVTWERVPHFHKDIEILTVTSGKMAYSVNGKTKILQEGDTIVVNSNQIHYSMSTTEEICRYVIAIFNPDILCSSVTVEMQAVKPFTDNPDIPYLCFYKQEYRSDKVYELVTELPLIRHDAFAVTKQMFNIWEYIRDLSRDYGIADEENGLDGHMKIFKSMIFYISNHYQETITLDSIAEEANISKSLCNEIFKEYSGESPITYLMHFRARKVAEYLSSTSYSMNEIANLTGFAGASYMTETFKKFFDKSPREFRKSQSGLSVEQINAIEASQTK